MIEFYINSGFYRMKPIYNVNEKGCDLMHYTEKYSFLIPPGEDHFNEEHQNENWKALEKILTESSITGNGTQIEKIDENGTIKITFNDQSSTIFYPMEDNGDVSIEHYNPDGTLNKEEIRKAWETIAGTNLRLDFILKHSNARDDALWTALAEAGISVNNVMSSPQFNPTILDASDSIRPRDRWIDKTIKTKVVWGDQSYTEYTLLANGKTQTQKYDNNGNLLETGYLSSYTDNLIATNVRIAQLEKKFEFLTMELQRFNIPIPGSLFTPIGGNIDQAIRGCEFSPLSGTTGDNTVLGYYTFDQIMTGFYSLSAHIIASANHGYHILRFQILDGDNNGRIIATCDIKASFLNPYKNNNGVITAGMYEGVVGFAFHHQSSSDANRRITVRVSTINISGVAACDVNLDYIILNHAQTAFGGSYVY